MTIAGYRMFTGDRAFFPNCIKLDDPTMSDPLTASTPGHPSLFPGGPAKQPRLWAAAQALEASFLAEMLKAAGLGETPETFGGGAGEDQFASFLRQEQADALVEAGGIGLAEMLYQSLLETQNDSRPASGPDR